MYIKSNFINIRPRTSLMSLYKAYFKNNTTQILTSKKYNNIRSCKIYIIQNARFIEKLNQY